MFTTSSGGPGTCTTAICSSEVIGTGIKGCKPTDNVSMSCAPKSGDPGDRLPSGVFGQHTCLQILPRWRRPQQLPLSRPRMSFPCHCLEGCSPFNSYRGRFLCHGHGGHFLCHSHGCCSSCHCHRGCFPPSRHGYRSPVTAREVVSPSLPQISFPCHSHGCCSPCHGGRFLCHGHGGRFLCRGHGGRFL